MTRASRCNALLTLAAALAFLAAGCGSSSDCTLTPELARAPTSCMLPPLTAVVVNVRWCNCGAATVCKVTDEGSGIFELEPQVNSCDASCPANPNNCPFDSVQCTFQSPDSGNNYHLYVISGQSYADVPMTVTGGAPSTCT